MKRLSDIAGSTLIELRKIYGQWKYKRYILLTALLVIGIGLLNMISGGAIALPMGNFPYFILWILNYILAPIGIFMLASDLMAGEIESNQIKIALTKPIARYKVLFGKMAAVFIYIFSLYMLSFLLSGIFSLTAGLSAFSPFRGLLAYIVGFLPTITITAMATFISVSVKSSTASFSLSLLVYIALCAAGIVFSNLAPALFTSYMGIGRLMIGSQIPIGNLMIGIGLLLGYGIVFASLSTLQMERKEF